MKENEKLKSEFDWSKFHIGIPCKYAEVSVIPKHIWQTVENELICKCRDGELVLLELVSEYASDDEINADLSAMYGIGIVEYTSIWKKRVDALKLRENGWVKVKMKKI